MPTTTSATTERPESGRGAAGIRITKISTKVPMTSVTRFQP